MKIRLLEEFVDREVELVGKVLCTRSDSHDMSWEFQKDKKYDLFKQLFEDDEELFVVFNNGWYSNFKDINHMSDEHYDFVLIKPK